MAATLDETFHSAAATFADNRSRIQTGPVEIRHAARILGARRKNLKFVFA